MNGYLLDTNAALIALTKPEDLTSAGRTAILTGPNLLSGGFVLRSGAQSRKRI